MFAWRRTAIRRRVLVNLRTDKAIEGVLWATRGELLVLRGAVVLEGGKAIKVDGEVVVEMANVDFVQVR